MIPVGMSRYKDPAQGGARTRWPDLDFVETDLDRFDAMFGAERYRQAGFTMLPRITGTAGQITDKLTEIADQVAALPGLTVLLIWSGHGEAPNGGDLRLATFETYQPLNAGDGFSPAELVHKLGGSGAKAVCLIFDVCQAAAAGGVVGAAASQFVRQPLPEGKFPGMAALFSAHAFEQAEEGRFAEVMERVLRDGPSAEARKKIAEEGFGGFNQHNRFLMMSELESVLGVEFELLQLRQAPVGQHAGRLFPMFLNPLFKAGSPPVNVEVARRRWLREQDVTEHFLPKARGLEPGEEGWFFTGRHDVSRQIAGWLDQREDSGAENLYVLTGNGGTGKSSIIGRMVALSDEKFRGEAVLSGWDEAADGEQGTLPAAGRIDAALHLRKLTAENAAAELSDLLGVAPPKLGEDLDAFVFNLPPKLPGAERPPTIVLDALDEAGDPVRVAERLIKPLAAKNWRILVGTRPSRDDTNLLERLGPAFQRNLDAEPTTQTDIEQYVAQRLNAAKVRESALIAHRVAEKANDNFLYARVTTSGLLNRPAVDLANLDQELGANVGEAFARDLAPLDEKFRIEFGRDDAGATAILEALAWGEGEGLPLRDGIWATVATAVGRPNAPYSDQHVRWVLREAGRYILESGDGEQAVYRLFHQSLVDHFRIRPEAVVVEYQLASAMAGLVPHEAWDLANPYLVRHLPAHLVSQPELLEQLCTNPWYLRGAIALLTSDRLADLLARVDRGSRLTPATDAVAKSVRRARVALSRNPGQLAAQLQARLSSETDPALRRLIRALPTAAPPNWLRARKASLGWRAHLDTTQTFGAKVRALAFGSIDGHAVIAVGAGTEVHFWDPRSGNPNWMIGNDGLRVTGLALGTLGRREVVAVSAGYDSHLVIRDARTGAIIGEPMPTEGVVDVALGRVEGRNAIALRQGSGATVRSIDSGQSVIKRFYEAVAIGQFGGAIVTVERVGPKHYRVFNCDTGRSMEPVFDEPPDVRLFTIGEHSGYPVVGMADYHGNIELRVLQYGSSVDTGEAFDFPIRTLIVGDVEGELIVAAGNDAIDEAGYVRIREPMAMEESFDTHWAAASNIRILGVGLAGFEVVLLVEGAQAIDPFSSEFVASGPDPGTAIQVLSGAWSVPRTRDERPLRDRRSITLSRDHPMQWPVHVETWGTIGGKLLQARGSYYGAVWIFDDERKEIVYGPFSDIPVTSEVWLRTKMPAGVVSSVALGTWSGRGVLAVAHSRTATVFDIETGNRLGSPETPNSDIVVVALGEIDGRPILATGSGGGAVTVWEGPSMQPLASIWLDTGATGIWLGGTFLVVRTADQHFHVFDVILGA